MKNTIVRAPYYGAVGREMMDDLAAYVGATVIDEAAGDLFQNVRVEHLGYVEKAEATAHNTTFYGPKTNKEKFEKRIKLLETKLAAIDKNDDAEKVQERYASLTGKVYTLHIPMTSDIENQEELDRVEDAINACKGALEHGYVPGCGAALYRAAFMGFISPSMRRICAAPLERIVENTGSNPEAVKEALRIADSNVTYDARLKVYDDCLMIGIIDSFKVISEAFKNGISVGTTLLSTKGIIAKVPEKAVQMPYEYYEQ